MRHPLPRGMAVALLVAVLTALLGCGGGGPDDSTMPPSNSEPAKAETSKEPVSKPDTAYRDNMPMRKGDHRKAGDRPKHKRRDEHSESQKSAEPRPDGCPGQLNIQQCAELGEAAAHPTSAAQGSENGCPAAMSRELCHAAAQAEEEAEQTPNRTGKPSECPDGLTQAQCVQAAESIEAAAK